ncbi:MAG: 30S ribosomal protein S1 [Cyanobacteria bacterium SW_9_44_58]|nr:MAG: 30S ribosomal protein S1 [Cyanobacteria bacterium SW_9_44_58]
MTSNFTPSSESQANIPFSQQDFEQALADYDYQLQKGQVVRGKAVTYDNDVAYIDVGGKSPGLLPLREAALESVAKFEDVIPFDEELEFLVIREQNAEGQVTLSRRELQRQQIWETLEQHYTERKPVEMHVTGSNRGGVKGEIMGLRAFVPRSHLLASDNLDDLIGQNLTGLLIEVNSEDNRLVLSQREAAKADAMGDIIAGTLVEGTIVNLKPYGAFVELGTGVTGLLHIKQVSQKRVESLESLFSVGETVKVMIIDVDEHQGRIALSTKELEHYPGQILDNKDEVMAKAESRTGGSYREN